MSRIEEFIEIYEYIQSRLLSRPNFELNLKRSVRSKLEKFLEDNNFPIWEYLTFQFAIEENRDSRFKTIPYNHIVGKNALKRWQEKSKGYSFLVLRFLMSKDLNNPLKEKEVFLSDRYLKEQREKYFNSPRGYLHCQSFERLLYDEDACKDCRYNYFCSKS